MPVCTMFIENFSVVRYSFSNVHMSLIVACVLNTVLISHTFAQSVRQITQQINVRIFGCYFPCETRIVIVIRPIFHKANNDAALNKRNFYTHLS